MNVLIVGGSSGLGLELAEILKTKHRVFITGRKDPQNKGLDFRPLNLSNEDSLATSLNALIAALPNIDLFIYTAGFYQEGKIDELADAAIAEMDSVGLRAPAMLLNRILRKQQRLDGCIVITSTSQFTPRLLEPMYTAVKAGLAMLAKSVAQDERIGKTLVVAPAGMKTKFWAETDKDTGTMLDPKWVAEQITSSFKDEFRYREIRILRGPARIELVA